MKDSPSVLLVDDDRELLNGLRRVLHKEPYSVLTALCAEDALKILKTQAIEVVVSDEMMPGLDGIEFLKLVAKHYPATVRLMLTGKADFETIHKAVNEGQIFRYLTKPCNEIELALHIRQALEQHDLLSQARRMLGTLKMQAAYIRNLEKEAPGITEVKRDERGAIVIDDISYDTKTLLKQIEDELK